MGLRGPAPEPTALKLHRGNPGKRPLNQWEPQPLPVPPACPAHLDADAKKEWRRLVKILMRMRVLTEADGMALASLCQALSTMTKAQQKLNETQKSFQPKDGDGGGADVHGQERKNDTHESRTDPEAKLYR